MIQANGEQSQSTRPRSFDLVLLAGALNPSPLRRELDIPAFYLPVTTKCRMIDLWLDLASRHSSCCSVRIAVSSPSDVRFAEQAIESHRSSAGPSMSQSMPPIKAIVDPNAYRGPAGLIRDIAVEDGLRSDAVMVVGEVSCQAPPTLDPLFEALQGDVAGLVGASDTREPAGVYAFTHEAIQTIPPIGYQDIKEQLLPQLYQREMNVRMACVTTQTHRLRDRESYISLALQLNGQGGSERDSRRQRISRSAHVSSASLIQSGVTIEDGAVIHESIVMEGATIGGGAVISRSIVGPGAIVQPREVVRSRVVTASPKQLRSHIGSLSQRVTPRRRLVTHMGHGRRGG